MLFNSLAFAIFLPIVFVLHWALPQRYRWMLLLAASYYFYMSWSVPYIALILFATAISYACARLIERAADPRGKKLWLVVGILSPLALLFFFKYFNFFAGAVSALLMRFALPISPITLRLMLPVGISFFTFQTLSYTVDVYRGTIPAEKHFGYYALFVSFFPQLVAGPIERTANLLPQIRAERGFDCDNACYGLKLMAWGFFKKIVVSDLLAVYVDRIYDAPTLHGGFTLIAATVFFAFQIYCDFSGYSDIAIGTAKLFNINLMRNFNSPYFSASIREFWSRWHISLSSWLRDYVYIPLGGSRVGKAKHIRNLLLTFLASGIWHGANYTYIVWGLLHGLLQSIETLLPRRAHADRKGLRALSVLFTFLLCCFCWIFFRANTLADAGYIVTHLFSFAGGLRASLMGTWTALGMTLIDAASIVCALALLFAFDLASVKTDVIAAIDALPTAKRWAVCLLFLFALLMLLPAHSSSAFVYFQF